MASRTKVLSMFKTLLRTREQVFGGDNHALEGSESFSDYNIHGQRINVTFRTYNAVYPWELQTSLKEDLLNQRNLEELSSVDNSIRLQSIIQSIQSLSSSNNSIIEQRQINEYEVHVLQSLIFSYILKFAMFQFFVILYLSFNEIPFSILVSIECLLIIYLLYNRANEVHYEKLTILPSLGFQICQETMFGKIKSVQFVPTTSVKAFVINETIKMQRVIPYIAAILHQPDCRGFSIIPIFEKSLPRLRMLEKIYKGIMEPN